MVSKRYLGKAADIEAAIGRASVGPERTCHLAFGDLAAVWSVLERIDAAGIVDAVVGSRRTDAGASVGTYLASVTATTAADRWVHVPAAALDHRRFWDAMGAHGAAELTEIERRITARVVEVFGVDLRGLVLDMTIFATYIDSANDRAPIAQRGHAKQKRPTCAWSASAWWCRPTGPFRCSATPTTATDPTSPSSPKWSTSWCSAGAHWRRAATT